MYERHKGLDAESAISMSGTGGASSTDSEASKSIKQLMGSQFAVVVSILYLHCTYIHNMCYLFETK
jgi:hypothetical protein